MEYLRESRLYAFCMALYGLYMDSALHRALAALGAWCNRQIDTSRVLTVLCREGAVARAWPESLLCRLLWWLVNLPGLLLHRLYLVLKRTFQDSFFTRLAFEMGHETAIAQSWLIMLLWVIPFSRWNNVYSLMGFALLLAFIGFVFCLCWAAFGSVFRRLFSRHARAVNMVMALLLVYCAVSLFLA